MIARGTAPAAEQAEGRRRWIGCFGILLGVFVYAIDVSVADALLPAIVRDLGVGVDEASLVIVVYMIVLACLIVPAGALGDRIGARPVYIAGVILFGAGSAAAGLASDLTLLVLARALQAIGAALLAPTSMALLNHAFPSGDARKLAFGLWSSTVGIAVAVGPFGGSVFETLLSWRYAFFVSLPLILLSTLTVLSALSSPPKKEGAGAIDSLGLLLVTLGLFVITAGFQSMSALGVISSPAGAVFVGIGWPYAVSPALPLLALGTLMLGAFFVVEARRAARGASVIFDVTLLRGKTYTWALVTTSVMSGLLFLALFVMPLYVSNVLAQPTLTAGLVTSFVGVGLALGGFLNARLPGLGDDRIVLGSILLQGLGYGALMLFATGDASPWASTPALTAIGLGWGTGYARLVSLMLSDVPKSQAGVASGAGQMGRQLGGAVVTALAVTLIFTWERAEVRNLDLARLPPAEAGKLESALRLRHALPPELAAGPAVRARIAPAAPQGSGTAEAPLAESGAATAERVRAVMVRTIDAVFGLGVAVAVLSLLAALRLRRWLGTAESDGKRSNKGA